MNIEDNFLDIESFKKIQNEMISNHFPWYYINHVANTQDNEYSYMCHLIYNEYQVQSIGGWNLVEPIINKLKPKSLLRIKANLYTKTDKLIKHGYHSDQDFDCKSALYFVNTNNGYTRMKKERSNVESIENRVLHFNSHNPHHSTTCTDAQVRITINFNYF